MACTSDAEGAIVTAVRTDLNAEGFVTALTAVRANMMVKDATQES